MSNASNLEFTGPADPVQLERTLLDLTQAVRKYSAEQRRVPAELSELVRSGYLAQIPEAPAGRRFAINQKLQVYVANP